MLEVALANAPGFVADDRELQRSGGSYTVDTLTGLREELGPDLPLCLLVGGDAFNSFFEWHRPRDILRLAHLAVMRRPGSVLPRDPLLREELERRRARQPADLKAVPAGRIWLQAVTQLDISSTRIRRAIADGKSPRFLLPDAVLDVALASGCYAARPRPASREDPAPEPVPPATGLQANGPTASGPTDHAPTTREATETETPAQRGHDAA
jgi:nicotinate-nucleotide adenylyltransferase